MAFPDPISFNPGSGAVSLARVSSDRSSAVYQSADGSVTLRISHERGARKRSLVSVTITKIVADPLVPATNRRVTQTVNRTFNHVIGEFVASDIVSVDAGVTTLLTASTNANLLKLVAGEY